VNVSVNVDFRRILVIAGCSGRGRLTIPEPNRAEVKNYETRQVGRPTAMLLDRAITDGAIMPYEFGEHFDGFDDLADARRRKQERQFRELYFLFKTAPDFETKLSAALELDCLCDEMGMLEDLLSELEVEPANDA
jgi:hypothetical protein